jgi:hypothetical protein
MASPVKRRPTTSVSICAAGVPERRELGLARPTCLEVAGPVDARAPQAKVLLRVSLPDSVVVFCNECVDGMRRTMAAARLIGEARSIRSPAPAVCRIAPQLSGDGSRFPSGPSGTPPTMGPYPSADPPMRNPITGSAACPKTGHTAALNPAAP